MNKEKEVLRRILRAQTRHAEARRFTDERLNTTESLNNRLAAEAELLRTTHLITSFRIEL